MANYIIIDGGTTNTRINLVKDNVVLETRKYNVGAKKSIGDNSALKEAVKGGIDELLEKHNMSVEDIECILAAGMITSEFGLYKLNHITVPAGIKELNKGMKKVELKDISKIPFVFIPGVKLMGDSFDNCDMMRGEEAELMGILTEDECIYVLPGSHSKIIRTDKDGRITEFWSMLTGEMIGAVARETILKDALDLTVSELDREYLLKGYEYCENNGVNKSLFKVRILKNLFGADPVQVYSFFMGVILHDEIKQILTCSENKIVLGGKKQIRCAMYEILHAFSNKEIVSLSDQQVEKSNIMGMIKIYELM